MKGIGLREYGMSVAFILLTELVIVGLTGTLTARIVLMALGLSAVLVLAFLAGVEYEATRNPSAST